MSMKHCWATKLSSNDSTAQEEVGILRKEWSSTNSCFKTYRYVQAASDTTVANGTALAFVDAYGKQVTSDISDASQNQPAGAGIGVITPSYYGWIETGGYHSAVLTNGDDDIADGDTVILSSADGTCDSVAAGTASTHRPLGIAVADDVNAANTVATYLTVAEL